MFYLLVLLFISAALTQADQSFPGQQDEVTFLPGVNFPLNFRHFSGYLESTNQTRLHYWFFESQNGGQSNNRDPLVLVLDANVASCSSLMSALTQIGPIRLNHNGTLSPNKHSWNRNANILFIEFRPQLGFSYIANNPDKLDFDYKQIVQSSFVGLKDFYRKFPQYKQNALYMAGERISGVYIPALVELVSTDKLVPNLKGIVLGNAFLHSSTWFNSMIQYEFNHGIIDLSAYQKIMSICCGGIVASNISSCADMRSRTNPNCLSTINEVWKSTMFYFDNINMFCQPDELNLNLSSNKLGSNDQFRHHYPACRNYDYVEQYLNLESVKKHLHVELNQTWFACDNWLHDGFQNLRDPGFDNIDQRTFVRKMINQHGVKFMIYSGDLDPVFNLVANEWFVDQLGIETTHKYDVWLYEGQIGGYKKVYGNNQQLCFATIRGAGYPAAQDKPGPLLELLEQFWK